MRTEELLRRLTARGLVVVWDGQQSRPALRGRKEMVTPALLALLAFHREALAQLVQPADADPQPAPELPAAPPPEPEPAAPPMRAGNGGDPCPCPTCQPNMPGHSRAIAQFRAAAVYCQACRRNWGRGWLNHEGLCPECLLEREGIPCA
jgi:hypothetical protein